MEQNTKEILDSLIKKAGEFEKKAKKEAPDTDKKEEISTPEMIDSLRKEAEEKTEEKKPEETKEEKAKEKPEEKKPEETTKETKGEKTKEKTEEKKPEEKKPEETKEEKTAEEYPVEIISKEAAVKLIQNMDAILKDASLGKTVGKVLLGIGGAGAIGAGAYQAGKLKERATDVTEDKAIAQAFYRVGAKAATEAIISRMNAGGGA